MRRSSPPLPSAADTPTDIKLTMARLCLSVLGVLCSQPLTMKHQQILGMFLLGRLHEIAAPCDEGFTVDDVDDNDVIIMGAGVIGVNYGGHALNSKEVARTAPNSSPPSTA